MIKTRGAAGGATDTVLPDPDVSEEVAKVKGWTK
jgi:hypothetical protein